jgi:hypothetical protein
LEALCGAEWKQRLMQQALRELQLEVKAEHYQVFHLVETPHQRGEVGSAPGRDG